MQTQSTAITAATTIYTADSALTWAKRYLDQGFAPIPVVYRTKSPTLKRWNEVTLSEQNLPAHFGAGKYNIGVALGQRSNGLVDIDIDDDLASKLAPAFLPETGMIFGRSSSPRSHWIYRCDVTETKKFIGEVGMIVELRGDGAQTVFPGSVHETGETITFDVDGEPTKVDYVKLNIGCTQLRIATTLLYHWQDGFRHELSLAAAGFLAKSGWKQDDVLRLITAVANAAGDLDVDDRRNCVSDTYEKIDNGMDILGYAKLSEIIGHKTADKLALWCGSNAKRNFSLSAPSADTATVDISTETRTAEVFSAAYKEELIFSEEPDSWYRRDNQVYRPISPVVMQGIAKNFIRKLSKEKSGRNPGGAWQTRELESYGRITRVIKGARSELRVERKTINKARNLFGLADGTVYDLDQDRLTTASHAVVTDCIGTFLDDDAQCPNWLKFLDRIFAGDKEVIAFVQRAVGYTLSGEVSEQCLFVLIGKGANGKSTFLNALSHLFGDYSTMIPMHTLMVRRNGNDQTNDLAGLPGKRFVAASEGEQGQRLAESKIKLMTGGDQISARRLFGEYFTFEPQFKLWLATNNLPQISGTDEAIWRRIRVIPFPVTIPPEERDPKLNSILKSELPGILSWALQGHRDWKQQGLKPPAKVTKATGEYRLDNDTVGQFIDVCCESSPATVTMAKDLYCRYSDWVEQSGLEPVPKTTFGKTLAQKGFDKIARSSGSAWKGLKLKPTGMAELLQRKGLMQAAE